MKPETRYELHKAGECLENARGMFSMNFFSDAGRNAYFAEFHCAKALLFERMAIVVKTHGGVHREFGRFAKEIPELSKFANTLNKHYDLKSMADYEIGPNSTTSSEDAETAIETATQFMSAVVAVIGDQ